MRIFPDGFLVRNTKSRQTSIYFFRFGNTEEPLVISVLALATQDVSPVSCYAGNTSVYFDTSSYITAVRQILGSVFEVGCRMLNCR